MSESEVTQLPRFLQDGAISPRMTFMMGAEGEVNEKARMRKYLLSKV